MATKYTNNLLYLHGPQKYVYPNWNFGNENVGNENVGNENVPFFNPVGELVPSDIGLPEWCSSFPSHFVKSNLLGNYRFFFEKKKCWFKTYPHKRRVGFGVERGNPLCMYVCMYVEHST
jgi:hypothetical protein